MFCGPLHKSCQSSPWAPNWPCPEVISSHRPIMGKTLKNLLRNHEAHSLIIMLWVNWPFDSGKEAQKRYPRWQPSWISDQNDFSYFWSTSRPDASYNFQVNWPLGSREEAKNWFSRRPSIGTILAIFYLQDTPMLPTQFRVNWPFGSGEEVKNIFLKWPQWWPSWISNMKDFSFFWSTSLLDASYQVWIQLDFVLRRSGQK